MVAYKDLKDEFGRREGYLCLDTECSTRYKLVNIIPEDIVKEIDVKTLYVYLPVIDYEVQPGHLSKIIYFLLRNTRSLEIYLNAVYPDDHKQTVHAMFRLLRKGIIILKKDYVEVESSCGCYKEEYKVTNLEKIIETLISCMGLKVYKW